MDKSADGETLGRIAGSLGVGGYGRHVFLCVGDGCCKSKAGEAAWDALKKELKIRGVGGACFRTKVGCLRVCAGGPLLLVYPEGYWYHGMTAERIPRFVEEQLINGRPIREWIFAANPLG